MRRWTGAIALVAGAACARPQVPAPAALTTVAASAPRWCTEIPRPANQALERVNVTSDWFDVYRAGPGVYAFVEARQFQETISYLVVGETGALLLDTGLGMAPLRPLVEQLTPLPVRVLNSHTHYDHVGGNAEWGTVLALDTPYTRANQAGFAHAEVGGEAAAESVCGEPPAGLDVASYRTRPWTAAQRVADGDALDLGGRRLEILHVPGHTPDAVALLDRAQGLLFTGDTYYDAPVWLYVPETDLDAYEHSIARLARLAPALKRLLPAHNTASADPARLGEMQAAIRQVREGRTRGESLPGRRVLFTFPGFSILTAQPLLDGRTGDRTRGGSGLTAWP
jgi:glyoxylase-like metal-dependent hydrolase (beta-lactamase superfamily II)